jgi:plasmid maintenance system antidote protein VapI
MDASTPTTALRKALAKRGTTNRWLAKQTGIHESEISRIAKGKDPSAEQAGAIAVAMGETVTQLGWPHYADGSVAA